MVGANFQIDIADSSVRDRVGWMCKLSQHRGSDVRVVNEMSSAAEEASRSRNRRVFNYATKPG